MTTKEKIEVYWNEISELPQPLFEEFWEVLNDSSESFLLDFLLKLFLILLPFFLELTEYSQYIVKINNIKQSKD